MAVSAHPSRQYPIAVTSTSTVTSTHGRAEAATGKCSVSLDKAATRAAGTWLLLYRLRVLCEALQIDV